MGGGDLNAKKAWHPNTLRNQERVWKAEQAATEEKKRIVELERERLLERERAELNKLAKSNLPHSSMTGDDRLHWMYEKPDKKVQQEEYLLGKAIEKNNEQAGKSEADEIPAVSRRVVGSSMLTVSGDTQVDLARKMREDPLLLVKERERAARAALLNNPVQRARLAELLRKEQKSKENKSKSKKKKDKDLDSILAEKLHALSGKKGIDLAVLLASDSSSSESSDEKTKKKKKKNMTSKSKGESDINDLNHHRHKSKHDSKKIKKQKGHSIGGDKHSVEDKSNETHVRSRHRDSSDDRQSSKDKDLELQHKSKHDSKDEPKKSNSSVKHRPTNDSGKGETRRKKRHHSNENESACSYVKKQCRDSSEHDLSNDDQQTTDDRLNRTTRNYVSEERYWSHKHYSKNYQELKCDQYLRHEYSSKDRYMRNETHSKKDNYYRDSCYKNDREGRQRDAADYRNSNTQDDYMNKNDKERKGQDAAARDKGMRNNKCSGLSEAEKAAKLAEMVAAGAEREKQRERRVAKQLAEKDIEDQPSAYARSHNVIHQLPDTLESRIHSNRHFIQRDQRHMNENFARR